MLQRVCISVLMLSALTRPAWAAGVPAVGSMAPAFALSDQSGRLVSLDSLRGKWLVLYLLVLYFYPKNDTPGYTQEACSFRDDMAQLTRLGAQIVAVSIDSAASNAEFAEKYHLPFPLLADKDG